MPPLLPSFFLVQKPPMQLAATAALAAGEIIRQGYRQAHQIDAKGVGDLVSQVDFDADSVATGILRAANPELPILSEELNPETGDSMQDMWIVDPLDGTTAYLMKAGHQFSSVLIALRRGGETELGLVYFPLVDEWFFASRGAGAFKDGLPLKFQERSWPLADAWIEMNQYGDAQYETPFFAAARTALRSRTGARIVTSTFPHAGVAMRIAEQRSGLTAAIHDNQAGNLKQGPWDIAANQLIFEEAGGVFLNPDGDRTSPFDAEPIVIAPTRELAEQMIERACALI